MVRDTFRSQLLVSQGLELPQVLVFDIIPLENLPGFSAYLLPDLCSTAPGEHSSE